MKKLMLMFVVLFMFGCESGFPTEETVTREKACDLCKENRCKDQLNNCNQLDLCVRFVYCVDEKHDTCDQCNSDKDLTYGFPTWKEFADCVSEQCSDVCDTNAVENCSK